MSDISTTDGWTTLQLANLNLLNFAAPERVFYPNERGYSPAEYGRKVAWVGERLRQLNADVACFQEVWDESALRDAIAASGVQYSGIVVPGAERGAQGTPRVGIATRLMVLGSQSFAKFPQEMALNVPELGLYEGFERPVLSVTLQTRRGTALQVIVVHLKSKRPKFLLDDAGSPLEDRNDPRVIARASLRSLIMRGAEAAALRCLVVDVLQATHMPLIVAGDFNDAPSSVTSQLVAATSEIAFDRGARDTALWHASDVQTGKSLYRDVAYSHVHQGHPEVLDQIWVSEEFVAASRFAQGDVRRVDYFNDHLNEGRDRSRSDHGFVRATLRLREQKT